MNSEEIMLYWESESGSTLSFSLPYVPPVVTFFNENGKEILKIQRDGTIEICEGYTPTEAGTAFLDVLEHHLGVIIVRNDHSQQPDTLEQAYERAMSLVK